MKKSYVLVGVGIILVAGAGIFGLSQKSSQTVRKIEPNTVQIQNYSFKPAPLTVKKGTKVIWRNNDIARHNVAADEGSPSGGPKGPLLSKGESFSYTFTAAGTYKYHCDPHPYMHGVVEVTE